MYIQSSEGEKSKRTYFSIYFLPSVFHSKPEAFSLMSVVCGYLQEGVGRVTSIWDSYFSLFLYKTFVVITKLGIIDILLYVLLKVQSSMGNIPQQCPVGNYNNKQM